MRFGGRKFFRWVNGVKAKRYGLTKSQLQKIQSSRGILPVPPAGTATDGNRRGRRPVETRPVRDEVGSS